MIPRRIKDATNRLGPPKGWDQERDGKCVDLWIRVTEHGDCQSAWGPTPEELAILSAGGSVVLSVVGGQPPVNLSVEPQE